MDWIAVGHLALNGLTVAIAGVTLWKTLTVVKHTNGMLAKMEASAEEKGRREQKADDGNT